MKSEDDLDKAPVKVAGQAPRPKVMDLRPDLSSRARVIERGKLNIKNTMSEDS